MVDVLTGSVESLFFEYKKREALFQHTVGIGLRDFRFAPNALASNFVNSRLLIDLFAIVDIAIDEMFDLYQLKTEKKKSKLTILMENQKVLRIISVLFHFTYCAKLQMICSIN